MNREHLRARRLTRRDALRTSATLFGIAVLAGCDALSTDPADPGAEGAAASDAKEAPDLATKVAAGDLPALGDRLPDEPLVVEPVDRVGRHGGTWNSAILGPADTSQLARTIEYDNLVRWDVEWTAVIPNVAESFDVGRDGAEFTFTLRKGMRWSDGSPFTADDVVFAFADVLFNPELYPTGAAARYNNEDGSPATVDKLDDHRVRFTFAEPHGLFLDELATASGADATIFPRHYLEEFHRDYSDDAEQLASDEGYESWVEMFLAMASFRDRPEVPTLFPWYFAIPMGESNRVTVERNPYYWKVDPDGRQLPYLDRVTFEVVEDVETILLKVTNGEFHFHTRHFNDLKNKPIVADSREEGGYDFVTMVPSTNNEMVIMLNLTHKDPALREVFQSLDFRVGLSYAINREEVIAAVFQRQGTPAQAAPREGSTFFDADFLSQFIDYDPDEANRLLDLAGFADRDADDFRLRADGKRISFTVEVATPTLKATWMPAMELIKKYWRDVGVDIQVKGEDRSLWQERMTANEHDATVWVGEGGLKDEILYGFYYLPNHAGSRFAIAWADWYQSDGDTGEEPPADAKAQLELYDRVRRTLDKDEQNELFAEIVKIAKAQFYTIGVVQLDEEYGIVSNDFHNVPKTMPYSTIWPTPAPTGPEQYFIGDS